jgi:hypothetical protein
MPSRTRVVGEFAWSKTLAFRSSHRALRVSMMTEFVILQLLLERLATASDHQFTKVLFGEGTGMSNPSRKHTPVQMLTAKGHWRER